MSSQVLKAVTPPTSATEPSEAVREQIAIQGRLRCPYCHDACEPSASVACRECLARHHSSCWQEQGTCASCGSEHKLVAETPAVLSEPELEALLRAGKSEQVEAYFRLHGASPEVALRKAAELAFKLISAPSDSRWPLALRLVFLVQSVVLAFCSLLALEASGPATLGALACMSASLFVLLVGRVRAGRPARGVLRTQLTLGLVGGLLAALVIETWNLHHTRGAVPLFLVGGAVASASATLALGLAPRALLKKLGQLLTGDRPSSTPTSPPLGLAEPDPETRG